MTTQLYRFTLRCPGCNKEIQHDAETPPDMKCGDCLMDRVAVETFQIWEQTPIKS